MAVLVDGGVRRGVDALKARALGAQAVCVGRPVLYGGGAGGAAGAERALAILTTELERAMQLCGVARVADIDRELIA
jgi:isopentenyl diphosphate isomerase/L-lactate dehydrogenase-like FMN-dependent dehydrogenase